MSESTEVGGVKDWRDLEGSYSAKVFMTVLFSLILVTGILGNSITIRVTQVLRKKGYLQKNVTDHMVSLACSDLLVLLIGMPVELYSAIWFPFMTTSGDVSCKIYNFLFEACSYATIFNIATLSYERYVATCQPFRYKMWDGRRTCALIAAAWIVSFLVALPLLFTMGAEGHVTGIERTPAQNLTFCTNLSDHWPTYRASMFAAFIMYMIVLIGVAFMCRAMIRVLRKPVASGREGPGDAAHRESTRVMTARKQTIIFLGELFAYQL